MKLTQKDALASQLMRFSLSTDAAKCYLALVKRGALSSNDIAREIGILPNSVYRLMRSLEKHTVVVRLNTYPMKFQAIPRMSHSLP